MPVAVAAALAGLAAAQPAAAADTCAGLPVTTPASETPTELVGSEGDDVFAADPGQRVTTGGGNDTVCGSDGFDEIDAGEGNDRLYGLAKDDFLIGGPGTDSYDGGTGYDTGDRVAGEPCTSIEAANGLPGSGSANAACPTPSDLDARHPAPTSSVPCDLWAAVDGDDNGAGAFVDPFRTVERLVNSLRPGQTGCLKPGTYVPAAQQTRVRAQGEPGKPITLRTQPGQPAATVNGLLWVQQEAHDVRFLRLRLSGNNSLRSDGRALASPIVNGTRITFMANTSRMTTARPASSSGPAASESQSTRSSSSTRSSAAAS